MRNKVLKAIAIGMILIIIGVILYALIYAFSSYFSISYFERSMDEFLNQ